ncbi:MAG: DUF3822 family protein [Ferruginibacter sp.]
MKIAFNILPVITDYEQVHLLVEAGSYGISFAWFTKDPYNMRGIAVYNLTDKVLPEGIAAAIEKVLQASPVFNKVHASVTICYDFKESLLVPEVHYNTSTAEAMLNLVHASDVEINVKAEAVRGLAVFNVYAVHKKIEAVLSRQFPAATIHHSTSLQLEKTYSGGKSIHCIFFHNSIKVFMFNEQALQFVQQFNYDTPVDATYHLLNCCEQYDFKPAAITLVLSGMVDEKSKLYTELYRYFINIEFEKTGSGIELHDRIRFYPSHFFSHLTVLASCVS